MSRTRTQHSLARTSAATLGAPVAAIATGIGVVATLPVPQPLAFAVGVHVVVPLWVALGCLLPLVRTGARAWAVCLLLAGPFAIAIAIR